MKVPHEAEHQACWPVGIEMALTRKVSRQEIVLKMARASCRHREFFGEIFPVNDAGNQALSARHAVFGDNFDARAQYRYRHHGATLTNRECRSRVGHQSHASCRGVTYIQP